MKLRGASRVLGLFALGLWIHASNGVVQWLPGAQETNAPLPSWTNVYVTNWPTATGVIRTNTFSGWTNVVTNAWITTNIPMGTNWGLPLPPPPPKPWWKRFWEWIWPFSLFVVVTILFVATLKFFGKQRK